VAYGESKNIIEARDKKIVFLFRYLENEVRHNTNITASTAYCPKEVRILFFIGNQNLA
jgi:hypothetical protein